MTMYLGSAHTHLRPNFKFKSLTYRTPILPHLVTPNRRPVGAEGRTSWKVIENHGKSWNLMEGSVSVTKYDLEVSQNF